MKISWSKKAEKQLDQIFEYIAQDSSFYAYRTVQKIIEKAEGITQQPKKGRIVPEYEQDHVREVFHHSYRIIYQLTDDQIQILSVIHDRRLLSDDPKY